MSKDLFTNYFNNNSWNGKESLSGPGSDYEQTKFLIPELNVLLKRLDIKTILDVPCGDFNWMKMVNLNDITYHGGDIVDKVVALNNKKYKSDNISFSSIDIVNDLLPKYDMIMVRDCLVHLNTEEVFKALQNIKKSKSKYLLTTNFTWKHIENNKEIKTGDWRRINLEEHPYNFKRPEEIIIEGNIQSHDRDKTMSLWLIKDIPCWEEYSNG
jgi:hypothetical protein